MSWFKAEEASLEQSMELIGEVNQAIDTLTDAGMEATAGAVEDLLASRGTPVEITQGDDGSYIVRTTGA